jgi:hypothetical protein
MPRLGFLRTPKKQRRGKVMPFFQSEPFDTAHAKYFWAGPGQPGFFRVTVRGHAQNLSFGFQLRRDPHFVTGLGVDVMGWTGPLTQGTMPYTVTGDFTGAYLHDITVIGANKTEIVHVEEVAFESEERFMEEFATSA